MPGKNIKVKGAPDGGETKPRKEAEHDAGTQAEAPQPTEDVQDNTAEKTDAANAVEEADWRDRYLRLAADVENSRKRMKREMANRHEAGVARALIEVLPVLDSFDRSLEAHSAGQDAETWREGFVKIHRQLRGALEKLGMVPVAARQGEDVDPNIHEVMIVQPSDEVEAGKILQTFQVGYKLKERLLRPAKVIVVAQPQTDEPQE